MSDFLAAFAGTIVAYMMIFVFATLVEWTTSEDDE